MPDDERTETTERLQQRVAARLPASWRAETGIFLSLWLGLMVAGRSQMFRDPGTFWHTVLGQRMLDSGRLIETDPFSFTLGGTPWISKDWLTECLMAVVHGISGLDGLLLVTVTVLACLYTWTAHRLLRAGLHWLPTTFVMVMALGASTMHFHVRPHIVTILGLGIVFAALCDFEAGRIRVGRLWWLIPLFIAWTNLHAGMPAGLGTLGLVVVGWGLLWWIGHDSPARSSRQVAALCGLVVACGLTALVNPYGLRLPRTWFAILSSPLLPRIIQEHAPPSPRGLEFWLIVLLGFVYVSVLLSVRSIRLRVTWLIPLVWLVLALSRVRNAPLFAITAILTLAEILPHSRLASWLARPGRDLFRPPSPEASSRPVPAWHLVALPLALGLVVLALQASGTRAPVIGRGWARLDPSLWPVELLPELRAAEREHPEGSRIFNDLGLGGFLIRYTPGLKVFIDDRCELYGDAWLADYVEAQGDPDRFRRWTTQYDFDQALVKAGSGFDQHLKSEPAWSLVRRTSATALYRRAPTRVPEKSAIRHLRTQN